MPRPASKLTINGTRGNDSIVFTSSTGYSFNGTPITVSEDLVLAGVVINGGDGVDALTGWSGPDELNGGRGDDTLSGLGGYDILRGGAGNDRLIDDWLGGFFDGGLGQDTLDLSPSAVTFSPFAGTFTRGVALNLGTGYVFPEFDILSYEFGQINASYGPGQLKRISGVENVVGSAGADFLDGSGLANRIEGGAGRDMINGRDGNDSLFGGAGDDQIHGGGGGGSGDDEINGGPGNDHLDGGSGRDRFTYAPGDGQDVIFNFNKLEGDTVAWFGTGTIAWSTTTFKDLANTVVGTFSDGTSIVFDGITNVDDVVVTYPVGG